VKSLFYNICREIRLKFLIFKKKEPLLKSFRLHNWFYATLLCFGFIAAGAQTKVPATSSWADAQKKGQASISVLWYDIEPFIYRDGKGGIMGVEYELMEGFKGFLKQQYNVALQINWVDAGSFENIYPQVKTSQEKGLFGLSFYSITEERKKEIKFSPPYMPDLNVLVTNNSLPVYESDNAFIKDLSKLKGYTMKETTMEQDLLKLKQIYFPPLPISNQVDDYEVLKQIAQYQNSFGYVPVSIYVVALQRGIKIKRQRVMATRREGFAAIYTKASDWDEAVNAYFNSSECKMLVMGLIRKYLGTEVADIILDVSGKDTANGKPTDIELLTKEREIVTQRLIDTAVEGERTKTQRNIIIAAGVLLLLAAAVFFWRFRTKHKMNQLLKQRNSLIAAQNQRIEEMNQQLNIKILQSRINPHFIFNSLNSIQYYITANDKKVALQYIARFSAFLRQILKSTDEMLIPAAEEAKLAEQYLWLEQSRFPDRFDYKINVLNGASEAQTPPLLIHALLETVLYNHVLSDKKTGFVSIDFMHEEDRLVMKVSDSATSANHLETDNLQKRIELINRAALKPITFLQSRKDETNFMELTIPQPLFTS